MIGVGVVGFGYWGPNLVRNFSEAAAARVVAVCDRRAESLATVSKRYPAIRGTQNFNDLLNDTSIDAIAVATPVRSHFELALAALERGKHVLVEKPMTETADQARQLIAAAERRNRVLMVDHTFVYTPAIRKIRDLVASNELGKIYYYDSIRVNLGLFQHDVNVIWDLAPHDLSVMDHIILAKPEAVVATGGKHLNGLADVAFITVYFPDNVIAHVNVNWLSPVKVRMTLIGGEHKMLVWNDLDADEKVKVYDKGVKITNREDLHELLVSYRSGDVWAPKVEQTEALKVELQYFIDCIVHDQTPFNDGAAGLRVVRLLEAADQSLKDRGRVVCL